MTKPKTKTDEIVDYILTIIKYHGLTVEEVIEYLTKRKK